MTDPAAIIAPLRRILGAGVGIAVTDPADPGGTLLPEEKPVVARAIPLRKLEFTAGRVAARAALAQIGHPPTAIPSAPDRSPVWPPGIVGSITHCTELCIATVAHQEMLQGLGIDIEPDTAVPSEMHDIILTRAERDWLEAQPTSERGALVKSIFCAKESAYKAIYPLTRTLIEFTDMRVTMAQDQTSFVAQTHGAPNITGHLVRLKNHVLSLSIVHSAANASDG